MKNKRLKLFLLNLVVGLFTIPPVMAGPLDRLLGRAQSIVISLPLYEQLITFSTLFFLSVLMWGAGAHKMAVSNKFPTSSKNAITLSVIALSLGSTIGMYTFMSAAGWSLVRPGIFRSIIAILFTIFVGLKFVSIFKTDGKWGQTSLFASSLLVVVGYWAMGKFFFASQDWPNTFGNALGDFFAFIYLVSWGFIILSVARFVFGNLNGKDWDLARGAGQGLGGVIGGTAGGAAGGAKRAYDLARGKRAEKEAEKAQKKAAEAEAVAKEDPTNKEAAAAAQVAKKDAAVAQAAVKEEEKKAAQAQAAAKLGRPSLGRTAKKKDWSHLTKDLTLDPPKDEFTKVTDDQILKSEAINKKTRRKVKKDIRWTRRNLKKIIHSIRVIKDGLEKLQSSKVTETRKIIRITEDLKESAFDLRLNVGLVTKAVEDLENIVGQKTGINGLNQKLKTLKILELNLLKEQENLFAYMLELEKVGNNIALRISARNEAIKASKKSKQSEKFLILAEKGLRNAKKWFEGIPGRIDDTTKSLSLIADSANKVLALEQLIKQDIDEYLKK